MSVGRKGFSLAFNYPITNLPNYQIRILKILAFLLCLGPLALLVWKGFSDLLGANPVDVVTRTTGRWTLIFLLLTLSITPLRKLLRLPWLIRFRRMLGLFAFSYGTLHLTTYIWLDKFFDVPAMLHDIVKRPFITAGMTAWTLMLPLALTSTAGWIRRLGGKRWQNLHRMVYLAAIAAVTHFIWLVKADLQRPLIYTAILSVLLLFRTVVWTMSKPKAQKNRAIAVIR